MLITPKFELLDVLFEIALVCDDSKEEKEWIEFIEMGFQFLVHYYFEVCENVLVDEGKSQFGRLVEFERRKRVALQISNTYARIRVQLAQLLDNASIFLSFGIFFLNIY